MSRILVYSLLSEGIRGGGMLSVKSNSASPMHFLEFQHLWSGPSLKQSCVAASVVWWLSEAGPD